MRINAFQYIISHLIDLDHQLYREFRESMVFRTFNTTFDSLELSKGQMSILHRKFDLSSIWTNTSPCVLRKELSEKHYAERHVARHTV